MAPPSQNSASHLCLPPSLTLSIPFLVPIPFHHRPALAAAGRQVPPLRPPTPTPRFLQSGLLPGLYSPSPPRPLAPLPHAVFILYTGSGCHEPQLRRPRPPPSSSGRGLADLQIEQRHRPRVSSSGRNRYIHIDLRHPSLSEVKALCENTKDIMMAESNVQGESVSCYCRVDGGFKTVVNARKFVPGARLCMQPDVKPNKRKSRSSRKDRCRTQAPLLPGLPDDLAISCLMRVPRIEHPNLRLVSRRLSRLLSGNYYYSLRKKFGMAEEWVYVFKRDRDQKISWHAFDPVHRLWKSLPPVPPEYSEAVGFGCAVLSGCYLYLFGGKDPVRGSMRRVVFYNTRTNKWHRAPDMLRKRQFFGSCVINNCLYVAGGECEGIQRTLRSAEVYNPNRNRWSCITEMNTGMVPFIGVVYDGKWFLKGLDSHRQVVSEVYLPTSNVWSTIGNEMVAGWRNPSISFDGHLYSADCRDGCKLKVYDADTGSWTRFMDSRRHLGGSRAFEAVALVSLNGKLCVVRNNMSITLVDVSDPTTVIEIDSARTWEAFARKGQYRSFMANLWSTIAGRSLKTHIIHCQVLQV